MQRWAAQEPPTGSRTATRGMATVCCGVMQVGCRWPWREPPGSWTTPVWEPPRGSGRMLGLDG